MAFKDKHVGNNANVACEFPCPDCGKETARGTVKKSDVGEDDDIGIHCDCPCGKSFVGTVKVHPAGLDVEVTIDDERVKDSDLTVYGF